MTDTLLTQNQAREAVYLQWKTEWEILHSQTVGQPTYLPYQFENLRFVEPASPQRWVRVSVRHLSSDQETIASSGNRRYQRNTGRLQRICPRLSRTSRCILRRQLTRLHGMNKFFVR